MKRLHTVVGLIGIVAFLGTGAYMRLHNPHMGELDGGTRMLLRSRHIYLLLASLLNLGLGTYRRPSRRSWGRALQCAGSWPIVAAPPLLVVAFFREAHLADLGRPFTNPAIVGLFVGMLCHAVGGRDAP